MNKHAIALSLAGAATLSACVATEPVTPAPVAVAPQAVVVAPQQYVVVPAGTPGTYTTVPGGAVVVQPTAVQTVAVLRPGVGRVNSINRLSQASNPGLEPVRRIGLTMDDGSVQYVDTSAPRLSIGDRVEITPDSRIRYPVASSRY